MPLEKHYIILVKSYMIHTYKKKRLLVLLIDFKKN